MCASANLGLTVSATTRAPRKGEVDGVNYFFLTREEFDRRVANGEFVEWAEVHGNCYGTLVSEVTSKLASGASLILEIDVQGALQVKERFPEAVLIFIKPPSLEKPCIDDLLEKTDHNRFLLASLASKRACDINSMLRGQHNRVLAVQDVDDITIGLSGADTISMAMDEIVDGDISYDEARYEKALGHKVAEA